MYLHAYTEEEVMAKNMLSPGAIAKPITSLEVDNELTPAVELLDAMSLHTVKVLVDEVEPLRVTMALLPTEYSFLAVNVTDFPPFLHQFLIHTHTSTSTSTLTHT